MAHRSPLQWVRGDSKKPITADEDVTTDDSINDIQKGTPLGSTDSNSGSDSPAGSNLRLLSSAAGSWRQAWDESKGELAKMLPPEFQPVEYLDVMSQVQDVHDIAQRRAKDTKEHQQKIPYTNKTYREVYGKVADCANKFQIVGNLVAQAEPVYSALPWALISFGIQCAVGEDEAYHTMLDGAEFVSDLSIQYPTLEQLYAKIDSELSKALRTSLVKFYKAILRFQVYAINYFDPDSKARRAAISFNPVTAAGIKKQREEIDTLKHEVDDNAALVSYEVAKTGIDNLAAGQKDQDWQLKAVKEGIMVLSGRTGQAFQSIDQKQEERNKILISMWKEPLDEMRAELESREIEKAKENLRNVRNWLSAALPREDLLAAKDKRHMDLGDWLLDHPRFRQWQSADQSSLLWLYGFAGTGKTGLVCRVIKQLEASMRRTGRIAFFFCSNDKASNERMETFSRSDPEEALRSIVSQLATSHENNYVAPILQDKYDTFGPGSDQTTRLSSYDCIEILVTISENLPVTIILDAFDECDQSRSPRLVQYLQDIMHRSQANVRIFISTRPFPAIEDHFVPDRSIEVLAANNGSDVKAFIHTTLEDRIQDESFLNGHPPEGLKEEIITTLSLRAGSMFLYASLLLNQLCDKNHNDDATSIRKKLESLPRDLSDVYTRIMAEIHDDKNNSERSCLIAQNTFKWLICAQEPLQADVFLEAISPPERRARHEEVIRACRTLVAKERNIYEFSHYSVREHVVRMEEYRSSRCHLVATKSCLNILDTSFGTTKSRAGLLETQKVFEQYAVLYWPLHYEGIRQEDLREQRSAINNMLRSLLLQGRKQSNRYQEWFQNVRQKEKQLKENKSLALKIDALQASPLSPLFAACVFGLEDLISKFGRELDGLNKLNDHGQTALCLAIENNKLEVVKALLNQRFAADPNLLNPKAVEQLIEWNDSKANDVILYASALQCAAANGRYEIAEYLIQQGAHIDLVAGYYGSPLQAAALKGHVSIVELLFKKGAEPNSQGGYHGNALQAAARSGQCEIINLLLENKPPARVDVPGGHYGSALRAAVFSSNSDAVWALLEEKADPNAKIKGRGYLLDEAACMGPTAKDIVRDLVTSEAQTDLAPKGNGVHIMHLASRFGMAELVEHCLKNGCQVDMVTTQGPKYHRKYNDFPDDMTPLGFACAEGHANIVELLLEHGAPFEEDRPRSGRLWTAAYQGHASVVDLLLQRFKESHTAEETKQFFLQRPHPRSGHPIMFAGASSGSADVVETLIHHGAKYESNWYKATPLLATATFGCPEVTKVLLDYHRRKIIDVCIDQQANNGRTALYEACSQQQPVIAMMLLDAGADFTITEKDNTTPLQVSCFKGLFRVVSSMVGRASRELDRKAFLDFLNSRHRPTGNTGLIDCAERDRLACLNLLLNHGASYTTAGNDDFTILHASSRHDNPAIIAAILSRAAEELDSQRFLDFINTRHKGSGKTALVDCAERGRLEAVNILLRHGADYEIPGDAGNGPLHWASINGHPEVARSIIKNAKPDDPQSPPWSRWVQRANGRGFSALMEAALKNNLAVVKVLMNAGVDYTLARVDDSTHSGCTALHDACFTGSRETALFILDTAFANLDKERFDEFINARNYVGKTALLDAADSGRPLITRLLISKYGADFAIANNEGCTILHLSAWKGHALVVSALIDSIAETKGREVLASFINRENKKKKTALRDAAESGRPEIIQLLFENGANHRLANDNNVTPLHTAAANGHITCVSTLLLYTMPLPDSKSFINQQNWKGNTALIDARLFGRPDGRPDIVRRLLEHGADYSIADNDGWTPLHYCAFRNRLDIMRSLLEYAARDKDQKRFKDLLNRQGGRARRTALHDVTLSGHVEVLKILLQYKPIYDLLDDRGGTPLLRAIQEKKIRAEVSRWILEYASKDSDRERFKKFMNKAGGAGDTPWKAANRRGDKVLVDALKATGVVGA